MTGDVQKDTGATRRGEGAEVFNDWASKLVGRVPFLDSSLFRSKGEGSSSAKWRRITGQSMCSQETITQTLRLVEAGTLKNWVERAARTPLFTFSKPTNHVLGEIDHMSAIRTQA